MTKSSESLRKAEITAQGPLRISPLFNDAFLWIFGRQDSKEVTRSLVNAVLSRAGIPQIGEVAELRADTASPGGIELRTPRTDVVIVSEEGMLINLEAQRERVNVNNKALFYASKLLCEHTPKGGASNYSALPQVVVIMLVEGWNVFGGDSFLSVGRIRWRHDGGGGTEAVGNEERDVERQPDGEYEDGSDRALYVIVELDKVKKRYTAKQEEVLGDESLAWLYLLAGGYRDDHGMDAMMEQFDTIQEFAERYRLAMGDPELKRAYERYCEARMEYNDMIREGKLWARRQGHDEGIEEGRNDIFKRMRALGYDEDAIAAIADGL